MRVKSKLLLILALAGICSCSSMKNANDPRFIDNLADIQGMYELKVAGANRKVTIRFQGDYYEKEWINMTGYNRRQFGHFELHDGCIWFKEEFPQNRETHSTIRWRDSEKKEIQIYGEIFKKIEEKM